MEECFDVLNNKGDYTGITETREKCHKEGCWEYLIKYYEWSDKNKL